MTTSKINSPGTVAALQYVQDAYLKHEVIPTSAESSGQGDMFKAGRLLLSVNDCRCSVPDLATIKDFELTTAPLPKGTAGRITRDGPNALAMLSTTKNPETSWDFTKWWASDEGQALFLMTHRSVPTRKSIA